jgi:hypothetical protein
MLGHARERPDTGPTVASAGRRMHGRWGIASDANTVQLARVLKLRTLPLTIGTDRGLTEKLQGQGARWS